MSAEPGPGLGAPGEAWGHGKVGQEDRLEIAEKIWVRLRKMRAGEMKGIARF